MNEQIYLTLTDHSLSCVTLFVEMVSKSNNQNMVENKEYKLQPFYTPVDE